MESNRSYLQDHSGEVSPNALHDSSFNTSRASGGRLTMSSLVSSPGDDSTQPKLSLRREIELRKAKQKEQEEANFTFKPHIQSTHRSKDPPGTPRENRFDKLYSDALKRHITTHLREETRDRELTFTPKMQSRSTSRQNSRPSSRAKTRENSVERSVRAPSSERDSKPLHERLSTPRKTKQEQENADLTFTPTISKRAKAIETLGSQEVAKRLYEHSKMIQEKLELKRNESEQKEKETCPFSPQLVTKRSTSTQRGGSTVVDRSMRFEEERQMRLAEARRQKEEEELAQATFKPNLSTSKRPATPSSRVPVHERLAVPLDKSVSPQVALAYSEYTFHPKLHTKRAPSPNRYSADYTNIHDRLFHEGQARQQEVAQERANLKQSAEKDLTFKPAINRNVAVKDTAPVFERLANHHVSPEKIQRVQEEITKDWTFSPALSQGTQRLTASKDESSSVFHRLIQDEKIMKEELERKRKLKEEKEEEEFRKLTFSPNLPQKSAEIIHTARSQDSMDVYNRLNITKTLSKSSSFICLDTASLSGHESVNGSEVKKIVKDERELQSLFERLNATSIHHQENPVPEAEPVKKVVLPKENVDAIFNRLRNSRTKSFILKYDTEEAEEILKQHSLVKGVPKIHSSDLDSVLDRLRGHTLSSAASHDMKTLSRSSSIDFSVGTGGIAPTSPSVLQQTLARRMSVTNKTFVDSLERSVSPLNTVPRSLSPVQTHNSRGSSPSGSIQGRNNPQPSPPKRLTGLNIFEEIDEHEDHHSPQSPSSQSQYLQRNHISNTEKGGYLVPESLKTPLNCNNDVRHSSFLDEPETIEEVQLPSPSKDRSTKPEVNPTLSIREMSGSYSPTNNPESFQSNQLLHASHAEKEFVDDQLPTPQLKSVISLDAGLVMPPVPPSDDNNDTQESTSGMVEDEVHDGITDLDSAASPGKEISPTPTVVISEPAATEEHDQSSKSPIGSKKASKATKKAAKKAGFVPQTTNLSEQDLGSNIASVDESDDF